MKPKLILLTKHYPFGTGEPFVGNEVRVLKDYFDIHIIADSYNDANNRLSEEKSIKVSRVPVLEWPNRDDRKNALLHCLSTPALCKELVRVCFKYRTKSMVFLRDIFNQISLGEKYYSYLIKNHLINVDESAIIYSFWNVYKVSPFLLRKKKNERWKIISRIHRVDIYNETHPLGRQPIKSLNVRLDRFYFLAQSAYDYYVKSFGKLPKNCGRIMPLGSFNNYDICDDIEGHEYFVIISCSRVVKVKRLDRIVKALEIIKDIPIHWIHFGDGELMDELKQDINTRINNPNIEITLMGDIENSKLFPYYHEINPDCFLNVSDSEGTPVSIMEALSFGIPIISFISGSIPEMLQNTENILLPLDAKTEDLAKAIKQMYDKDISERRRLRKANRALWNEKYNAETNTRMMAQDMLSLLGY